MLESKKIKDLIVYPSSERIDDVIQYSKLIINTSNTNYVVFYWNIYTGDFKVNLITNQIKFKSSNERLKTMTFPKELLSFLSDKSFYNGNMTATKSSIKKDILQIIDNMKTKLFEMEINKTFNYDELMYEYNSSSSTFSDINPVSNWPDEFKSIFLEDFLKNE